MEARHSLKPELDEFRREIRIVSSHIQGAQTTDSETLRQYVEDRIQPRVDDLTARIRSLRGKLWTKIARSLLVGGLGIPLLCLPVGLSEPALLIGTMSALIASTFDTIESIQEERRIVSERQNRGLLFLLDIRRKYRK